jgi:HEAT repeat protein
MRPLNLFTLLVSLLLSAFATASPPPPYEARLANLNRHLGELKKAHPRTQARLINNICTYANIDDERIAKILAPYVETKNPVDVRLNALICLKKLSHPSAAKAVALAQKDPQRDIQMEAKLNQRPVTKMDFLTKHKFKHPLRFFENAKGARSPIFSSRAFQDASAKILPRLQKLLRSPKLPYLEQVCAIQLLAALEEKAQAAEGLLVSKLKHPYWSVRASAAFTLGRIKAKGPKVMSGLLALLKDEIDFVAAMGATAISELPNKSPKILPAVIKAFEQGGSQTQIFCADVFASFGAKANDAVLPMVKALKDNPSQNVKVEVMYALEQIGPGSYPATAQLIALLSAEEELRDKAVGALGAIGPKAKDAVTPLIALLTKTKGSDRAYVVVALGKIGPAAEAAVPALLQVYRDVEKGNASWGHETKSWVKSALEQIGTPKAKAALEKL